MHFLSEERQKKGFFWLNQINLRHCCDFISGRPSTAAGQQTRATRLAPAMKHLLQMVTASSPCFLDQTLSLQWNKGGRAGPNMNWVLFVTNIERLIPKMCLSIENTAAVSQRCALCPRHHCIMSQMTARQVWAVSEAATAFTVFETPFCMGLQPSLIPWIEIFGITRYLQCKDKWWLKLVSFKRCLCLQANPSSNCWSGIYIRRMCLFFIPFVFREDYSFTCS